MKKQRLTEEKVKQLKESMLTFMQRGQYEEALGCIQHLYDDDWRSAYTYVKAFRSAMKTVVAKGEDDASMCYELMHQSYILTAQEKFDDFMIALEWYRPDEEKFWLPRRKQLQFLTDILEEFVYGDLDELFLSMPPRVGKSTLIVMFVTWYCCKYPQKANLYSSYTEKVVKTFYNGILEITGDPYTYDLKSIFPDFEVVSTDAKDLLIDFGRKKRYKSITARSIESTLNGACDASGLVIGDDLHEGIDEAKNKDLLAAKWLKVRGDFLSRKKSTAKILWIGTRWSIVDCIGCRLDMLLNDPNCATIKFKEVNIPALNEYEESNFDYLFNVGFSTADFKVIRASYERTGDMAMWYAPYMGQPIESEGAVFAPDDLRYFNGELPKDVEPDRIFMVVDPAWGGGDYVAAPVIVQYDDDLFMVDAVFNNSDKKITQPEVVQKAIKWGVSAIYIEGTKVTSSYAEGVEEKLKENGYRANVQASTKHWGNTGKQQRIFDKAPDIRSHIVFLNSGHRDKEYAQFMDNVFSFTMLGKIKHDDGPDSLAMVIVYAYFGSAKVVVRNRRF